MTRDDYIKTIIVNGIEVDIGMDDYSQCYFFEYKKDGELKSESCGTYNIFYIEYIFSALDPRFRKLEHKYYFEEFTPDEEAEWKAYLELFKKLYDI